VSRLLLSEAALDVWIEFRMKMQEMRRRIKLGLDVEVEFADAIGLVL